MTNQAMMASLRCEVARRLGHPVDATAGKLELLRAAAAAEGPSSAVELGATIRDQPPHPVLDVVVATGEPVTILKRWIRLERFGHTRNRTQLVASSADERHATVTHVAQDGGAIDPLADLFVWGMLLGLLERAACVGVTAELTPPGGAPIALCGDDRVDPLSLAPRQTTAPSATATMTVRWQAAGRAPARACPRADRTSVGGSLRRLLATDLVHAWRVDEAARALATSGRQLQRSLRQEGTSFSHAVARARIEGARELMVDPRVSLSEVAFCCGFSDAAHFSRLFRRHFEVPPSAYRELVLAEIG